LLSGESYVVAGAFVLECVKAGNDKAFFVARMMSAATLPIALLNAVL